MDFVSAIDRNGIKDYDVSGKINIEKSNVDAFSLLLSSRNELISSR